LIYVDSKNAWPLRIWAEHITESCEYFYSVFDTSELEVWVPAALYAQQLVL